MPNASAATTPTAAHDQRHLRDGHACRRHLGVEHARAARRSQRLRAAQVDRRLFVLTDADRTRHLLAVRVHGLDDVVALGDAVDGERRGAEVTALEEDLDLRFGRRLHGDAPQPLGVGRPEVDVAQAVRLGRILRGVEDRLRLLGVTGLLGRLLVFCAFRRAATLRRSPASGVSDFFFFASAVRADSSVAPPNSTARSAMPQPEGTRRPGDVRERTTERVMRGSWLEGWRSRRRECTPI